MFLTSRRFKINKLVRDHRVP